MNRPLRVHLVHQGFGDYVAGLVDGLEQAGAADGGADGIELTVTTLASGSAALTSLRSAPARHRQVALPRFRDPRSPFAAARAVRDVLAEPCDVLHWQAAGNPWVDLALLVARRRPGARNRRAPLVVTVHDMQAHPGDRSVLPGTFAAIRGLARAADRVIVHAPHVRDQAVAAGVLAERVRVVAHGELATRYVPAEDLPLAPSEEPSILFFGRAQGYKGLDLIAAAMPAVAERVPGARLVVAGNGPSIAEVFPADRPPPPWCELHQGRVPDDAVPGLFGRAAVVVLPYHEASQSGVAALAAGFGRPVVATAVPGLSDLVRHDDSGLLVEPGSPEALAAALIDVLTDQDLAARLAAGAARAARTELSWTTIGRELVALYHGLVHDQTGDDRVVRGPSAERRERSA